MHSITPSPFDNWHHYHFDTLPSTMDAALSIAKGKLRNTLPLCVTTETQTKGRGRYDRKWQSQKGNVQLTLALPVKDQEDLTPFSFIAALAVREVIEKNLKRDLGSSKNSHHLKSVEPQNAPDKIRPLLKWPNDILIEQKKCAGILLEAHQIDAQQSNTTTPMASNSNQGTLLIIGIGINVTFKPEDLSYQACCLKDYRKENHFDLHLIYQDIMRHFDKWHNVFVTKGFTELRSTWLSYKDPAHKDMSVFLPREQKTIVGTFHDLTNSGQLVLTTTKNDAQEKIVINTGDVFFQKS